MKYIKKFSIISCILLLCIYRTFCQLCPNTDLNFDYQTTQIIYQLTVTRLDLCCYACNINQQCVVWTYNPSVGSCVLKRNIGQRVF